MPTPRRSNAWLAPAAVLVLLLAATIVLHRLTARLENRATDQRFVELARDRVESIEGRVETLREDLLDIAALYDSSRSVERDEFHLFCQGILERHKEVLAISWNPRVREAEMPSLIESVAKEGIDGFHITELGDGPGPTPAGPAPERYPILYREPCTRPQDLGLDLFTDPLVRSGMAASLRTEAPALTAPAAIPPVFGTGTVLRSIMPVFRHDAPPRGTAGREEGIEGYVIIVLRAEGLLDAAVDSLIPVGIHVGVLDVTDPGDPPTVAYHGSRLAEAGEANSSDAIARRDRIEVCGRTWEIASVASSAFETGRRPWGSLAVLVAGAIVSLVVAGSVRRATGRTREVQRLVDQRTLELSRITDERNRIQEETIADYNRRLEAAVQDLRRAQELVSTQERLRALGQMASGVAHDFNNALSPVLGFTELLLAAPQALDDRAKATGYLKSIQTAARDAASVVRRLKAFYRQQEEAEPLVPVDLNSIVRETIGLTQPRWRDQALAAGARIEMSHEAGDVPPVLGAEAELREALTNLIFNAIDAMPKGGSIAIATSRDGDGVVLAVRDTGAGMTEEVRRRCLEPFFTTKGQAGTGMGLAMVYGIVHRHDGSIGIDSEPGKGTTIRLRFHAAPEAVPGRKEKTTRFRRRRVLRVLVVDDEPMIREVVKSYLELDGHTVDTACDGQEGWERFQAGAWDLVLTDAAMPRMNGDELAAKVKGSTPGAKVIQLTGFGAPGAGRANPNVDLVLSKPVTIDDLRVAVQQIAAP